MNSSDLLTKMGTDAAKWTDEFLATFPDGTDDWGTLVGWFANAIEAGREEGHTISPDVQLALSILGDQKKHLGSADEWAVNQLKTFVARTGEPPS